MTGYTGEVHVGGPAAVRELTDLVVTKVAVGPMDNNAYLLRCRTTGVQVLIDAAAEPDRLLDLIGPDGLQGVVTTHAHRDHWGALADVVAATGATTYAHPLDAAALPVPVDVLVEGSHLVAVGGTAVEGIHLAGHTPGGLALLYDDPEGMPHVFSGDSLFPGGVGATGGDAAAFGRLMDDVERKLFDRLPDETWVYPGHGADTTLGTERPHLPQWRSRGW